MCTLHKLMLLELANGRQIVDRRGRKFLGVSCRIIVWSVFWLFQCLSRRAKANKNILETINIPDCWAAKKSDTFTNIIPIISYRPSNGKYLPIAMYDSWCGSVSNPWSSNAKCCSLVYKRQNLILKMLRVGFSWIHMEYWAYVTFLEMGI